MPHATLARLMGARRAIVSAIAAILAALVALGVIPQAAETAILSIVGVLVAYAGGDAYVQARHVSEAGRSASASTTTAALHAALSKVLPASDSAKPAGDDPPVIPSTGA